MSEEFNKEFLKLSEKDQKAILNLIQLKNMNKKDEYKKRIDKAIEYIKHSWWLRLDQVYDTSKDLKGWEVEQLLKILEGE